MVWGTTKGLVKLCVLIYSPLFFREVGIISIKLGGQLCGISLEVFTVGLNCLFVCLIKGFELCFEGLIFYGSC